MKNNICTKLLRLFDIPEDSLGTVPRLTITGNGNALIENHKGLVEYGSERIVVSGGRLLLCINGVRLELEAMNREEIRITGQILSVDYQ